MAAVFLTTIDNPYSPSKEFKAWHDYDTAQGYFSTEYLNRIYEKNLQMSKKRNNSSETDEKIYEDSINEIIEMNEELNKILPDVESENLNKVKYIKVLG